MFGLLGFIATTTVLAGPYECSGDAPNESPVLEIPAVQTGEVKNGKAWLMQQGDNVLHIAKVSGSAYEMGFALGQLYGDEISESIDFMISYYSGIIIQFLKMEFGLPDFVSVAIVEVVKKIAFAILDLNYLVTSSFVPQRFIDEL